MKRGLDLIISLTMIILLSLVFITVALLIWLKMGTPILFKQQRPGLHGKSFHLYKFRTMLNLHDENGFILADEHRLTKLGKFLRKYSIDEFPQLFNVVTGDMSLVGPRPLLMDYLPLYTKEQSTRHNVKPGITGWAQVNGRNAIKWEEKFLLDIWYVNNQSFFLDLKILILTIMKVIKREGIHHRGHVSMEKFQGSRSSDLG